MSRRADTPLRVTRAASKGPAPLPAVETKQSHAYGARGKAALDKQTTSSTAAIDDAFATSRQVTSMPPPSRPEPSVRQPKKSQRKQSSPVESFDQEAEVVVNGTVTQSATETGRPRTGIHGIQYVIDDQIPLPEPNKFLVFIMTAGKFLQTKQFWLCLAFSWLTFTSYIISAFTVVCSNVDRTATLNTTTDHVCYYGARLVGQDPRKLPQQMADAQVGINQFLYHTTKDILGQFATFNITHQKLSTEVHELSSQVGLHDNSISEIQSILPTFMVVTEKDGKVTIPNSFWQALAQKMNSNDDPTLWEGFLDANQANLQTVMSGQVGTMVDGVLASQKIVTSQQLEAALKENNHMLEEKFNGTLRTFQAVMLQQMKTTAQEVAKDVFDSSHLAKGQIGALAYSMLIVNMNERMRQTNYFSTGLGAIVEPRYTSATWREPTFVQQIGRWMWWGVGAVFRKLHSNFSVHPPTSALSEWSENGDCWCADSPRDATVKLQIGVRMPFIVYPKELIIEHIPSSGTRDIAAAPQSLEVWAKMSSADEAVRVTQNLEALPARFWPNQCGEPPSADSDLWVCSARGTYDIHAPNYLQYFEFPQQPWNIGLKTSSVVVKVTSNWGADHTCLYRTRLTGDEVDSKDKELED